MDNIAAALELMPHGSVVRDPDIIASRTLDFRRVYQGHTRALLRPGSVREVQQIVHACRKHGVPLVPQGGNTGYCTGATPNADGRELILSLERMTAIREVDVGNMSITADAGAILADVQAAASNAGLLMPLGLGSQASCTIGGNVSTNAGGVAVLRYGMARNIVMGLEVVLPDGSVMSDLTPLRKDNSGYDIKQLFIGAEGTLGIVTAVTFALARKPHQRVTALLAVRHVESLAGLLAKAQTHTGEQITSFEYVSRNSLDLLLKSHAELQHPLPGEASHYVLMEAATASPVMPLEDLVTDLLSEMLESGEVLDGTIATSERQRDMLWHLRENVPEGEVRHGGSVKHDVAVRISGVSAFITSATTLVHQLAPEAVLSIYGHVGDGNIHFNLVAPSDKDPKAWKSRVEAEISPEIHALAIEMGGTFSAEYGIGRIKRELLDRYGDSRKVDLMRKVKEALDPDCLFNPGKIVSPPSRPPRTH